MSACAAPRQSSRLSIAAALLGILLLCFSLSAQAAHRLPAHPLAVRAGVWQMLCTPDGLRLVRAGDPAVPATPQDGPFCPICLTAAAGAPLPAAPVLAAPSEVRDAEAPPRPPEPNRLARSAFARAQPRGPPSDS